MCSQYYPPLLQALPVPSDERWADRALHSFHLWLKTQTSPVCAKVNGPLPSKRQEVPLGAPHGGTLELGSLS